MKAICLILVYLLFSFSTADEDFDENLIGNDCSFDLHYASLEDFSNCAFLDPGINRFKPMTMPTCGNESSSVQGVTPEHVDYGESCFSYKSDIQPTNQTKIIIDFWYHEDQGSPGLSNYIQVGFLRDDANWVFVSENLAKDSSEWQTVEMAVDNIDVTGAKLAVLTLIERALFFIDRITVTQVIGDCSQEENEALDFDGSPREEERDRSEDGSCLFEFSDGQMTGLESCIEDWVDQGSEVKELPSCDGIERRFLLTPKSSFLPSKTQTNRALQLTNNTEIQIKLWVEAEEGSLIKCIKLALFTDSTDGDVNDGRNIFEQWDLCPKNREWDTFYIHPKVNTDTKLKVLIDMGLYKSKVFADYIKITSVENTEECYISKEPGQQGCY